MVSRENIIHQWGETGLRHVQTDALQTLDLPTSAKEVLANFGLPQEVKPFFTTDIYETFVPTLSEYARSVQAAVSSEGDHYYRIGSDYGTEVCVRKGTGEVVSIDLQGEYLTRFINISLPQFIECLYLVDRERAQFSSLEDDEIDRRVSDMKVDLVRIDPETLQDDENWWAVIMEQMENGQL